MSKYTSHLAGEFLAAGELARRGYTVSITLGNAKSIDIFVDSDQRTYRVDAKAIRSKTNWPISENQVNPNVIYIFLYLGSKKAILENSTSEFYIISGRALLRANLIDHWENRSGIRYRTLSESCAKNRWKYFR